MAKNNMYLYQQRYIIPKGSFEHQRNKGAGPGRIITMKMLKSILGIKTDEEIVRGKDWEQELTCTNNCLIVHLINDEVAVSYGKKKKYPPKEYNEEMFLRITGGENRPENEFAHFAINLFKEMILSPYGPQGEELKPPISFTFYLAYWKKNKPDVIFSARFPVKGSSGQFVDLQYGRSFIPSPGTSARIQAEFQEYNLPLDEEECKAIAASHSIRPEVFQQFLNDFWGGVTVPDPFMISWTVMESLLTHPSNSNNMQVRILWDDTDNSNNMDLGFEPDPFPSSTTNYSSSEVGIKAVGIKESTDALQNTSYTAKMFFGINFLNTTFQLRMYKGQNTDGSKTILIESIGETGHSYYDLNGLHP